MTADRTRERGQMLALFAICLVAIIGLTGLVIDGGLTMVQKREQQNVADAAAMAGAYSYANNGSTATAAAQALSNAAANGYVDGTDGVSINVNVTGNNGLGTVVATVTKPHRNFFSGVLGFTSWDVTTTATAVSGIPNGVIGAMPLLFNKKAVPASQGQGNEISFDEPGSGTQDVPQNANPPQFNWTVYCTANGNGNATPSSSPNANGSGNGGCNGDSNTVDNLINNKGQSTEVDLGDAIGPLNAGSHATLFSSLATMVGQDFPVAIVNDDGSLAGWAMFHLTGSVGGSTKQIRGYFVAPVNWSGMKIVQGAPKGGAFGDTVVRLTN